MLPYHARVRTLRGGGGRMSALSGGDGRRSRLAEWASSVPLVTLTIFAICVAVFVADNLGDFNANMRDFALVPYLAVQRGEVYRVVTAAYMHGGLMHIGMNMMSLLALGGALEPMFGSLHYALIQALFAVAVGSLYVALCYAISLAVPGYQFTGAVGFSGVLFAMAMDEVSLSPAPTRSVFGLFSVPTRLYPWVLMALLQFLLPNVSLVGHLAGVLVGLAHTRGAFKRVLPSHATLLRWEASPRLQRLVRLGPYRLTPASEVLRESGGGASVGAWLAWAARPLTDCVARRRGLQPTSAAAPACASDVGGGTGLPQRAVVQGGRLTYVSVGGGAAAAAAAGSTTQPSAPPAGASAAAGYTMAVRPPAVATATTAAGGSGAAVGLGMHARDIEAGAGGGGGGTAAASAGDGGFSPYTDEGGGGAPSPTGSSAGTPSAASRAAGLAALARLANQQGGGGKKKGGYSQLGAAETAATPSGGGESPSANGTAGSG
jgi:membrane associated rhomboid family serine protease